MIRQTVKAMKWQTRTAFWVSVASTGVWLATWLSYVASSHLGADAESAKGGDLILLILSVMAVSAIYVGSVRAQEKKAKEKEASVPSSPTPHSPPPSWGAAGERIYSTGDKDE